MNPLHRRGTDAESPQFTYEERPSAEESPLWEQSARPPASNPEDGLKRLLMQNDNLIVTRCALAALMAVLKEARMHADRSRC